MLFLLPSQPASEDRRRRRTLAGSTSPLSLSLSLPRFHALCSPGNKKSKEAKKGGRGREEKGGGGEVSEGESTAEEERKGGFPPLHFHSTLFSFPPSAFCDAQITDDGNQDRKYPLPPSAAVSFPSHEEWFGQPVCTFQCLRAFKQYGAIFYLRVRKKLYTFPYKGESAFLRKDVCFQNPPPHGLMFCACTRSPPPLQYSSFPLVFFPPPSELHRWVRQRKEEEDASFSSPFLWERAMGRKEGGMGEGRGGERRKS